MQTVLLLSLVASQFPFASPGLTMQPPDWGFAAIELVSAPSEEPVDEFLTCLDYEHRYGLDCQSLPNPFADDPFDAPRPTCQEPKAKPGSVNTVDMARGLLSAWIADMRRLVKTLGLPSSRPPR